LLELPAGQELAASDSDKPDGFSAGNISATNRRAVDFWNIREGEVTVAEDGRIADH
jgi:hypothetical protein